MRKIILLYLSLFTTVNLFSQDSKTTLGIELSPTITTSWDNKLVSDYSSRISYAAGLNLEYSLSKYFSIKTGLGYERKGYKSTIDHTDNTGMYLGVSKVKSNFDYLIIPILFKISTDGKIQFFADAGPYFGILLKQNIVYDAFENEPSQTEDRTSVTSKTDFGLCLGGGLSVPINNKLSVNLQLRYNHGLTDTKNGKNVSFYFSMIGINIKL